MKAVLQEQSSIYRRDAFLGTVGILRVGGRMNHAQLGSNIKHPIILSRKCHVSELVTRHCHERDGH